MERRRFGLDWNILLPLYLATFLMLILVLEFADVRPRPLLATPAATPVATPFR